MKKYIYIFEVILAFVVYDCLNYLFFPNDLGFLKASLHPYWIVVIFIPTRYGFAPGILTGILALAHNLYFTFGYMPTRLDIEKMIEADGLVLPIAFVLMSLFLGGIRQKYKNSEAEKTEAFNNIEKALDAMKQKADTDEKARKLLESRIVGETKTVKTLYETARRFNDLEVENIYQGCLEILREYLNVEKSSLYIKEGGHLVLKASYGWKEGEGVEGRISLDKSMMKIAFDEKKFITVKDILHRRDSSQYADQHGQALAMIPVMGKEGIVKGIVNIEKIDFLLFNAPNLELMQMIVEWASTAIDNKVIYEKTKLKLIFDEKNYCYSYSFFEVILEKEFEKFRRFHLPLTLSFIKINQFGFFDDTVQRLLIRTILAYLNKSMSAVDMIFHFKFDGTFAVISPLKSDADVEKDFVHFHELIQDFQSNQMREAKLDVMTSHTKLEDQWAKKEDFVNQGFATCKMPTF